MGVDLDFSFIASLLVVIAIGSFGIAGVGGGATNAAGCVAGSRISGHRCCTIDSIEPLIDMAGPRYVNGAITTGILTSGLSPCANRRSGTLDGVTESAGKLIRGMV